MGTTARLQACGRGAVLGLARSAMLPPLGGIEALISVCLSVLFEGKRRKLSHTQCF